MTSFVVLHLHKNVLDDAIAIHKINQHEAHSHWHIYM